jgi:histidinol dehydrogenase
MRQVEWKSLTMTEQREVLNRPVKATARDVRVQVATILERVRDEGDAALREFTAKFDRVTLDLLRVSPEEMKAAWSLVTDATLRALEVARDNIERFHRQQAPRRIELPTMAGVRCFREARAIERVGFYIPGGSAPLPSTVLMLGVPAMIAANPIRVLCTPPAQDGSIHPVILVAAQMVGIEQIFKVGGAQAIAAMAYGTESIPKVDKIYGPGNSWVTEAKLQVAADPLGAAIDLPAGPSEVLVIADRTADPDFVAADLLSQAEHGPDSQVILVTTDAQVAETVREALKRQLAALPRREIATQALASSRIIIAKDLHEALLISDAYAPEHLILQIHEPEVLARQVRNAGSVFLGPWSPESAGDYASGTNHVLPTYGYARSYGGLSLDSFLKYITFQHLSKEGLAAIGPTVEELAALEGLEAHRRAVAIRLRPEEKL